MTALAAERGKNFWKATRFTFKGGLAASAPKVWKGTLACGTTATGTVVNPSTATTLVPLGLFNQTVDNSAGGSAVDIEIDFVKERTFIWMVNDGAIGAGDIFSAAYTKDNQTVTKTSTGASKIGTIVAVDSIKGVLITLVEF